jgi:hypothetical protein
MSTPIDPVSRFMSMVQGTISAVPTAVSKTDLLGALEGKNDPDQRTDALAEVVAKKTSLTEDAAKPIAKAAVNAGQAAADGDKDNKTADTLLSNLGGIGGDSLQLSDPVMLWPWARAAGAALLLIICALAAVFIFNRNSTSSDYDVSLAVVSVAALIAALILVMGYKNVTISKGSQASSKGAAGGGAAGA